MDDAIGATVFEDLQGDDFAVFQVLAKLGKPATAVVVVDMGHWGVVLCGSVEDAADCAVFEDVAHTVFHTVVYPLADERKVLGICWVWAAGLFGERG
jgi:hypothetical protein